MHFCLMISLTLIHLFISLTVMFSILSTFAMVGETKMCSSMHLFNHGLYLLFNLMILFFFFDCARNSRIHSTDVLIFTTKRRAAKYGIPIPFLLFAAYFATNYSCKVIKFPRFHTFVYCFHLLAEIGLIYGYFGWYQKQLVNLTDATELDEINDVSDNEKTFNFE